MMKVKRPKVNYSHSLAQFLIEEGIIHKEKYFAKKQEVQIQYLEKKI